MSDSASTTGLIESSENFGRRLTRALIVISTLVIALAAGLAIHYWTFGSFVVVKNEAPVVARDVVIRISGETINLGDLAPGATRRRRLHPTGFSNVIVEFTNSGGDRSDWDFEYRIGPGEQVTLTFDLLDGGLRAFDSRSEK